MITLQISFVEKNSAYIPTIFEKKFLIWEDYIKWQQKISKRMPELRFNEAHSKAYEQLKQVTPETFEELFINYLETANLIVTYKISHED